MRKKRTIEKLWIYLASTWQIVTGIITTMFYLMDITTLSGPTQSMLGNFMFTYGMSYVTIGVLNAVLTQKYVSDDELNIKLLKFWIVLLIIFILLTDYVSITCLIIAITFSFAKNKAIRMAKVVETQNV